MSSKLMPLLTAATSIIPELNLEDVRSLALLSMLVALLSAERRRPHRDYAPGLLRLSHGANLGSFLINDTVMSLLSVSALLAVAGRHSQAGLLHAVENSTIRAAASFLLLDLTLYAWHRLNHRIDALWMLHRVHHSDRCVTVTTAFRLHALEIVLTTLVKAAFVIATGIETSALLANELVITLCVMFHHANISFRAEHALGRVLIVPRLHRLHHSARRVEHDSNYGAVLSVWDRLFGTLAEQDPVELGLADVPAMDLVHLIGYGWGRVETLPPQRLHAMIAEAAYYRAEQRGFSPGEEFADWFAAEDQILKHRLTIGDAQDTWNIARTMAWRVFLGSIEAMIYCIRCALPLDPQRRASRQAARVGVSRG